MSRAVNVFSATLKRHTFLFGNVHRDFWATLPAQVAFKENRSKFKRAHKPILKTKNNSHNWDRGSNCGDHLLKTSVPRDIPSAFWDWLKNRFSKTAFFNIGKTTCFDRWRQWTDDGGTGVLTIKIRIQIGLRCARRWRHIVFKIVNVAKTTDSTEK